jgi:hypothetical protein
MQRTRPGSDQEHKLADDVYYSCFAVAAKARGDDTGWLSGSSERKAGGCSVRVFFWFNSRILINTPKPEKFGFGKDEWEELKRRHGML